MQDQDNAIEKWFQSVIVQDYAYIQNHLHMVRSRNSEGNTALHLAVRANDVQAVRILAQHEAKCMNRDGYTALLLAASLNYSAICRILLPLEKNICTADGRNTLMVAAECGSLDALRILIGNYPPSRDSSGTSELDYAVLSGNAECVRLLLRATSYPPDDIKISMHLARKRCYTDIVAILEVACANSISHLDRSMPEMALSAVPVGVSSATLGSISMAAPITVHRPLSAKLINTATATAVASAATTTATRNLINFATEINRIVASPGPSTSGPGATKLGRSQLTELSNLHDHGTHINQSPDQIKKDVTLATAQTNEILQVAECTLDRPEVDIDNSLVPRAIHLRPVSSRPVSSRPLSSRPTSSLPQSSRGAVSGTSTSNIKAGLLNQSTSQMLARILSSERKGLASSYVQRREDDNPPINRRDKVKQELDVLIAQRTKVTRSLKDARNYGKYVAGLSSLPEQVSMQTVQMLEQELAGIEERIKDLVKTLDKLSVEEIEEVVSPIPRQMNAEMGIPPSDHLSPAFTRHPKPEQQEDDLLKENLDNNRPDTSKRPRSARLEKNLKELRDSCASVKSAIQTSDILNTIERVSNKISGIEGCIFASARIGASASHSQAVLAQSAVVGEHMQLSSRAAQVDEALGKLGQSYTGVLQHYKHRVDSGGDEKVLSAQYQALAAEQGTITRSMQKLESTAVQPIAKERKIPPERRHELLYHSIREERAVAELQDSSKTALMRAVLKRNIDECKCNFGDAGKTDGERRTALMLAAEHGFSAAIHLLVGTEKGKQDKHGQTALMKAAIMNHPEAVLILRESEGGMRDHMGHTALFYALMKQNKVIAELLKDTEGVSPTCTRTGGTQTELMEAASKNDIVRVYSLLPQQGKLQDSQGRTSLMYAVEANALPCVKLLAAKESGLTTLTSYPEGSGFTALMLAVKLDRLDAAEALLPYEGSIRRLQGPNIEDYVCSDAMRRLIQQKVK